MRYSPDSTRGLIGGTIKALVVLLGCLLLCRVTKGYFSVVMAALGVIWAFRQKVGLALACMSFFSFIVVINYYILPKPSIVGMMTRFGPLAIGMTLALVSMRRPGASRLPLGGLMLYLGYEAISSMGGWCPIVSYLKLINFGFYICGFWLGSQNLDRLPDELRILRFFMLAMAVIVVWGSLAVLPFPAIAYPLDMNMAKVMRNDGLDAANEYFETSHQGMTLFAGVTYHSQALGPICACMFALVLADMIFVCRKVTKFHLALLAPLPLILFMTRSRTGLLSFCVGCFMIMIFAASKIRLSSRLKMKIRNMAMMGAGVLIVVMVVAEISNQTMTRWIRKTDSQHELANRDLVDAVTSTRMGLYARSLEEFKANPIFGIGFQVNSTTAQYFGSRGGLVLSAPVEKGLLPMVVLGEGGVLGVLIFSVFLISFYSTCFRKQYVVTASMFTVLLAMNIGEATFFSPGGAGGIEWMLAVVSGFAVDMLIRYRKQREMLPRF